MPARLKLLTQDEYDAVDAELTDMQDRISKLGNVIGPAYGAPWCDKAIKLSRAVWQLQYQLKDRYWDQTRKETARSVLVDNSPT